MSRVKTAIPATGRLVGYARVSTQEQDLGLQVRALKAFGVLDADLFIEKMSAASKRRPQFSLMRKYLERGDTLIVYSLSRLFRDVADLLAVNKELINEGVALKSLTEPIDTRTADGKLMLTMRAAFAQFERDIAVERTRAGLANRRANGHSLGRKRQITDSQIRQWRRELKDKSKTVAAIAKASGVSTGAIYKYIKGGKSAVLR